MKKTNKIAFCSIRLSVAVLLLVSALTSCSQEELFADGEMPAESSLVIGLTLPEVEELSIKKHLSRATTAPTPEESAISNVAIFVFNGEGTKLENLLVVNTASLPADQTKWNNKTLTVSNINIKNKNKRIYVVANWGKSRAELASYTEETLKAVITTIGSVSDINDITNRPLLMSGFTQLTLPETVTTPYPVEVKLTRQVANIRVNLSVPKQTQIDFNNITWSLDGVTLTVSNCPDRSYLIGNGAMPTGVTFLNSDPLSVKHTSGTQMRPATSDLTWMRSVYIYENPLADGSNIVRLVLNLPFTYLKNSVAVTENYYQVDIKNPADPLYKIARNTLYDLTLTIVGVGLSAEDLKSNVNVRAEIL